MERLIKALGSLTEERYQGSYIGKILWEKQAMGLPVGGSTRLTIEGECRNFIRILVVLEAEQTITARLQVGLFLAKENNGEQTSAKIEEACIDTVQKWRVFSPAEIVAFVDLVGDYNEIHRNSHPVVPGLFLLQQIAQDLPTANRLELRFLKPLYAGQAVFLHKDKNLWRGYGPAGQAFSVKIRYFANSEE
jgi:hypothetical protein